MDVLTFLTGITELGAKFLSEAGQKALSEQVVITGIVLYSLHGHFKKIEKSLASVADNVSDLSNALKDVETSHEKRIVQLESRVTLVEQRTTKRNSDV